MIGWIISVMENMCQRFPNFPYMVIGLLVSWKQHSIDSLTSVKLQGTSYNDNTGDT